MKDLIQNNLPDTSQSRFDWGHPITAIALKIRQSLDLPTIWQTTADEVRQLLDCERVLLYQFAPDWSGQVVVESISESRWSLLDLIVGNCCCDDAGLELFRQGQFSARPDILADHSLRPCHAEFLSKYQIRANLVCPILHQSQLWGFLIAHSCTAPRQWLPEEINGLQQIAVHVGIAVYQAALLEQLQASKVSLEAEVGSRTFGIAQLAAIVEYSQDAIIGKTPNGIITSWNQAAENLLGYSAQEAIGQNVLMFIPVERQSEEARVLRIIHQGERIESYETQCLHQNGSLVDVFLTASPIRDENGNVIGASQILRDIGDRKQTELALQQSEAKYRHLINNLQAGVIVYAPDTGIVLCNSSAGELLGLTEDQMLGKTVFDPSWHFFREDGTVMPFEEYPIRRSISTGLPLKNCIMGLDDTNQTRVWLLVNSFPEFNASQKIEQIVLTFVNISDRKQAELDLKLANQQLSDRIAELNQRHWEMVKLSEIIDFLQACFTVDEACKALSHLIKPLFPKCVGGLFLTCASRDHVEMMSFWGESLHSEVAFSPNDCWALRRGRVHFVEHQSGLYCDHILLGDEVDATLCIPMIAQGETIGLFHLSTNTATALSESKQQLAKILAEQVGLAIANLRLQETLQHQSIRDPLTGLFNRRYLEERLSQELFRAQRQQQQIGVIMIDIDNFKQFNDLYGHDAGDYVLQTIGTLLKKYMRGSDIACRYGGEELILVLPDLTLEEASKRAEEIREEIAQITLSYNSQLLGKLTASFGVASFPQHGATGNALMQSADAALYRAKAAGRNQVLIAP